jgi:hypothetical protein
MQDGVGVYSAWPLQSCGVLTVGRCQTGPASRHGGCEGDFFFLVVVETSCHFLIERTSFTALRLPSVSDRTKRDRLFPSPRTACL